MISLSGLGRWFNRVLIFASIASIFALLAFGARLAGISLITHFGVFAAVLSLVAIVFGLMPIGSPQRRNIFLFAGLAYLATFMGPIAIFHFRLLYTIAAALLAIILTGFDAWLDEDFADVAKWYGLLAFVLVLLNIG